MCSFNAYYVSTVCWEQVLLSVWVVCKATLEKLQQKQHVVSARSQKPRCDINCL